MGMPGKQDDKAGLERETTTRFGLPVSTTHLKSCFIYGQVKEGCKEIENPETFGYWHRDSTCLDRSRSCLSSKGPWAAKSQFTPALSEGFAQREGEERSRLGRWWGGNSCPQLLGAAKKSKEEQPKHSHIQLWDRENTDLQSGQEKEVGTSSVCSVWPKTMSWKITLWGFLVLLHHRKSIKNIS